MGWDEDSETRPNGTTQDNEMQTEKLHDLREGGHEKKKP